MCLWKMPPSVNRKFALFAIFFEKSARVIFNMLILFVFIVFMQNLPQSCTVGFPAAGFLAAGAAASGPSRRACRSAGQERCRRGRSALSDRGLSAEAEGRAHLPEKAFLPFTGFCRIRAAASAQPCLRDWRFKLRSRRFRRKGRTARRRHPSVRRGAPRRKKKRAAHEEREQLGKGGVSRKKACAAQGVCQR